MESCTSALDMPFRSGRRSAISRQAGALLLCWTAVLLLLFTAPCPAAVIDRVVASVDDQAITLSEFLEARGEMTKKRSMTDAEVIDSMINRLLLLREAKGMRFEGTTDEEIIKDFMDFRIRSVIIIKEEAIQQFYAENMDKWEGKDYLSVRDEIERYLFEKEFNDRLKRLLEELRAESEIHVMLE